MKKSKISQVIVALVFLVAFNAIFFILGSFPAPASVWMAYGVVHFAYLGILATPLFVKKSKFSFENGAPLALVSTLHFAFQFVAGIIIMLVAPEGHKFVLVFYIQVYLILGFLAVSFVSYYLI